jgi:hypothetical protein
VEKIKIKIKEENGLFVAKHPLISATYGSSMSNERIREIIFIPLIF